MSERWFLIRSIIDLHKKNTENHFALMHELVEVLNRNPPNPKPQQIIITGPTTASALAALPGTELTIFNMIPPRRRLWDQCLGTNYRFESTSFVRMFPNCGHYFWYRQEFEMENGIAMCPQCASEEQIVQTETARVSRATAMGPRLRPLSSPPPPLPVNTPPPPPPPGTPTRAPVTVTAQFRRRVRRPGIDTSSIV